MEARIKIVASGPYLVSGTVRLARATCVLNDEGRPIDWAWGEEYDRTAPCGLCRCGRSCDKPYCDGTHATIDFDGELTADRGPGTGRREIFEGSGIVMTDDKSLCANYGFCSLYGGVWKEIHDTGDPEVRARVQRQVQLCPTGRLEYLPSKDGAPVEQACEPTIATIPNGALWVLGGIPIEAPDGFVYEIHNRVALCRCGGSQNKPFCDGTHADIGFEAL